MNTAPANVIAHVAPLLLLRLPLFIRENIFKLKNGDTFAAVVFNSVLLSCLCVYMQLMGSASKS